MEGGKGYRGKRLSLHYFVQVYANTTIVETEKSPFLQTPISRHAVIIRLQTVTIKASRRQFHKHHSILTK
jgi:hypothetical protein